MEVEKELVVDLWKTSWHGIEKGIKKREELMSKSRQFTKDMDIFGVVKENDEPIRYLAIREGEWEKSLMQKRLVIRTFTKGFSWKSSLEELLLRSLQKSFASKRALPVFSLNITSHDYLFLLERVYRAKTLNKPFYTFTLLDDDLIPSFYTIETDRFTIGDDWTVKNEVDEKIAILDGKAFNIGGKYVIKIAPKQHKDLDDVLVLFSAALKYIRDVEKQIEEIMKHYDPSNPLRVDEDEAKLYLNPRRISV